MTARNRDLLLWGGLLCLPVVGLARAGGLLAFFLALTLPPILFFRLREASVRYPWPRPQSKTYHVLIFTYQSLFLVSGALIFASLLSEIVPQTSGYIERIAAQGGAHLLLQAFMLRLIRKKAAPTRLRLIGAALCALAATALYIW